MLLDLSQLHGAAKHYERRFEPSAFDPQDEDYRVATPVDLVMDVEKAGGNAFKVTGHVRARLMLFNDEGTLDVIEMLREQFQLALPMKPLHDESCRGLCPICGANLNRTECGCTPKWEDPRLAPLKGLLIPEKEN